MKLKEEILLLTVLGMVISVIILSEIQYNIRPVPGTIFIRTLDADGNPEINIFCRANIMTETREVNDRELERVNSIFDYINNPGDAVGPDKGYYKLETGLTEQDKVFEIRIICINPNTAEVSYTILNETNTPYEIKEGYLVY